jgi:hypothetical protein
MLVYYCYRQKRDNPNDAFGCKKRRYKDADGLRQAVISDLLEKPSPSSAALAFIKNEVGELW